MLKIQRVALGTVGYKHQMCHKPTECAFTIISTEHVQSRVGSAWNYAVTWLWLKIGKSCLHRCVAAGLVEPLKRYIIYIYTYIYRIHTSYLYIMYIIYLSYIDIYVRVMYNIYIYVCDIYIYIYLCIIYIYVYIISYTYIIYIHHILSYLYIYIYLYHIYIYTHMYIYIHICIDNVYIYIYMYIPPDIWLVLMFVWRTRRRSQVCL